MQDIKLDFHRQARVWIEDRPQAIYPASETLTKNLGSKLTINSRKKRGSLEILIPVGAKFFYGLLGAEFIPNDSGIFSLEVLVSTNHEKIYEQSIASKLDQIRVGLPSEYSESVIDAVIKFLDKERLTRFGSGVLRFEQAAHSEIGSSNKFFRHIATTVVQLLVADHANNAQEVTKIVTRSSLV